MGLWHVYSMLYRFTRLVTASATWRHLVLSVVLRWLNSCTSQSRLSVLFGFQQLFNGLSNNKSKRISRGSFFVVLPAKRKPARLLQLREENSTENWINFVQMRQEKHHIFWFGRQISFWARFQWTRTGSFEVEVSFICKRTIFPRCENLL